jgi:hypothetical protein
MKQINWLKRDFNDITNENLLKLFKEINNDKYGLMFSIILEYLDEYGNNNYRYLTKVIIMNNNIINQIVEYVSIRINFLLTEQYNDFKINKYIISYKYMDYNTSLTYQSKFLKDYENIIIEKNLKLPNANLSLPLSPDIKLWNNMYDIKSDIKKLNLNEWNIIFPEIEYINSDIQIITGLYKIKDFIYKIIQYKYKNYSTLKIDSDNNLIIGLDIIIYDNIISCNEFIRKYNNYIYKIKNKIIISR